MELLRRIFGDDPASASLCIFYFAVIIFLAYRYLAEPLGTVLSDVINFFRLQKVQLTYLEITPPHTTEKSSHATQQLTTVLERLVAGRDIWGCSDTISLNIISTRDKGVRFIVGAQPKEMGAFKRHLESYLPDARFATIEDPYKKLIGDTVDRVLEIEQTRHYAFPLKNHEKLQQSDPVAYITGAMTKLKPDEMVAMQLVATSHYSPWTTRLHNKIVRNGTAVLDHKLRYFIVSRWWVWVIAACFIPLGVKTALSVAAVCLVISFFVHTQPAKPSPFGKKLFENVLAKLSEPLFRVSFRFLIRSNEQDRRIELGRGVHDSLAVLGTPGYQELSVRRLYPRSLGQKLSRFKFGHHLPPLFIHDASIFSASELASLYHFPYGDNAKIGNLAKLHSRTLVAPVSMKSSATLDVLIGQNNHHGEATPIGLSTAERERHMYILGGTGNGKSTMMLYSIVQDIRSGKGVAVIDPHGDLATDVLRYIPEDRIDDVVYLKPRDLDHPIGLNLLELPEGLSGSELEHEKDRVTESVVSVLRKLFSEDDSGGHRIEYVLRNTIHTAMTVENATIFTVLKLLTNAKYRKEVVKNLQDDYLLDFWNEEMGKAGEMQAVKMSSGVTNKIGRFRSSTSVKRTLGQPKSTINFDDIINSGKILICNFSKGGLGEDTSALFGTTILAKLYLSALRRDELAQKDRQPFYVYVDEFQNFATTLFLDLLTQARKYKLLLTMAEQSTAQQEDQRMVETILNNVGTLVCFRTGSVADEHLILPRFKPYLGPGEIMNLPAYNFYAKLAAVKSQEPLSGETVLLGDNGDEAIAQKAIEASRENYATVYKEEQRTTRAKTKADKKSPTNKKTIPHRR